MQDLLHQVITHNLGLYSSKISTNETKGDGCFSRLKMNVNFIGTLSRSFIVAMIDIDKFKQIMNNLITNSYKNLNPNGKVTVVLIKENQNIIIKVIDKGIGIYEKDISYIFERYYRSDL